MIQDNTNGYKYKYTWFERRIYDALAYYINYVNCKQKKLHGVHLDFDIICCSYIFCKMMCPLGTQSKILLLFLTKEPEISGTNSQRSL